MGNLQAFTQPDNIGYSQIWTYFYYLLPLIVAIVLVILAINNISFKLYTKRYAHFYNKNGDFLEKIKIDVREPRFDHKKGKYNIFTNESSKFITYNLLYEVENYFYILDMPDPVILGKGIGGNGFSEKITAETYKNIFDTKLIIDLNNISDNFSKYLTLKNIIIVLGVIGIMVYIGSGNKLW